MSPLTFIRLVRLFISSQDRRFEVSDDHGSFPYLSEPSRGLELERKFFWRA